MLLAMEPAEPAGRRERMRALRSVVDMTPAPSSHSVPKPPRNRARTVTGAPRIRSSRPLRLAVVGGLALVVGLGATGCTVVDEVLHGERAGSYDDAAALAEQRDIAWIPSDASAIDLLESSRADDTATVLLDSDEPLPADCVVVPRISGPTMTMTTERELPETYKTDEVSLCGDWAVLPTGSGWYGWTPVTEKASDAEAPAP